MVRKSIEGIICEKFTDYFEINVHHKSTRNRNLLLKVPKIRLELAKQGFYFQGVKLLNSSQIWIRQTEAAKDFVRQLTGYEFWCLSARYTRFH